MIEHYQLKSFKLVIKPGYSRLRPQDYMAIFGLCVLGSIALVLVINATV